MEKKWISVNPERLWPTQLVALSFCKGKSEKSEKMVAKESHDHQSMSFFFHMDKKAQQKVKYERNSLSSFIKFESWSWCYVNEQCVIQIHVNLYQLLQGFLKNNVCKSSDIRCVLAICSCIWFVFMLSYFTVLNAFLYNLSQIILLLKKMTPVWLTDGWTVGRTNDLTDGHIFL